MRKFANTSQLVASLIVGSLLLSACGGATPEANSPATQESNAQSQAEPNSASAEGSSSDPAELQKQIDTIRTVGALLTLNSGCSTQAVKMSKIYGGQDFLLALATLNSNQDEKQLCQVKLFADPASPRLQWLVELEKQSVEEGGKIAVNRSRPEKFRAPTDVEADQLRAIQLARKSIDGTGLMAPVVLKSPDGYLIYLLALPRDPKKLVTGPHYRVSTSRDGRTITKRSILSNAGEAELFSPSGEKVTAVRVEAVDADTPNEGHVYTSATGQLPLLVPTRTGVWKVDGVKIERAEQ